MPRKKTSSDPKTPSSPPPARLGASLSSTVEEPARGKLPRGASSLPRTVVDEEQRKRLVVATAKIVALKGYADAPVADILKEAGVSRATFYELFKDKEECFLYGFEKLSKAHTRAIEREVVGSAPLPEQLLAGLRAYLGRIDADLDLARAFMAEAESATARSRAAYAASQAFLRARIERWMDEVRRAYPEVAAPADTDYSLMIAGVSGHVIRQVRAGKHFSDADVATIFRFVLACLGLYEWARHAGSGAGR